MSRHNMYEYHKEGVLDAIEALQAGRASDSSASVRELAKVVGVSVGTLHNYLRQMEQEGLVEWTPGSHRSLRIVRG